MHEIVKLGLFLIVAINTGQLPIAAVTGFFVVIVVVMMKG